MGKVAQQGSQSLRSSPSAGSSTDITAGTEISRQVTVVAAVVVQAIPGGS